MKFLLILLNVFFVSFLDKPEKTSPQLSPRAVEQRARWGIQTDVMDYPVSTMYTDSLRRMGAKIFHKSRWFNGVTCEMNDELAKKVEDLKFVTTVEVTRDNSTPRPFYAPWRVRLREETANANDFNTDQQLQLFNLTPLHEAGFHGQGIHIAICDGAFASVNTLSCFRPKELELGHFDFTDDKTSFYGSTGSHGTNCLSVVSGISTNFFGAATQAPYYLMRSEEEDTESRKEMDNLVVALEKADSLGVNVFSASIGYYIFDNYDWDLVYERDMNGKSTRASRAATIAARKGMLVCIAIGNEGDDNWRMLDVPADADSVLTVGAVDVNGNIGDFSSYGPTADGRIKPEVCAVGVQTTVIKPDGKIVRSNGTSFSTPLLAGLAATLWSALPQENAMQIRERIIRSADRYDNPDWDQYGYGIPDAWKAYQMSIATHLEDVQRDKVQCTKELRDGQLFLMYKGKKYNVQGMRVE